MGAACARESSAAAGDVSAGSVVISLELDGTPAAARLRQSCQPGGLLSRAADAAVKNQAWDVEEFIAEFVMAERGRAVSSDDPTRCHPHDIHSWPTGAPAPDVHAH